MKMTHGGGGSGEVAASTAASGCEEPWRRKRSAYAAKIAISSAISQPAALSNIKRKTAKSAIEKLIGVKTSYRRI